MFLGQLRDGDPQNATFVKGLLRVHIDLLVAFVVLQVILEQALATDDFAQDFGEIIARRKEAPPVSKAVAIDDVRDKTPHKSTHLC